MGFRAGRGFGCVLIWDGWGTLFALGCVVERIDKPLRQSLDLDS